MCSLVEQKPPAIGAEVRHYVEQALSDNTRLAYQSDLDHFTAWGGHIPCGPDQVAEYLTAHAECHAIATLQRRLVSIAKAHTMRAASNPVPHELVKLTMQGIRRVHGKPQRQVAPLLKDELIVILSHITDDAKGKRDRALLMLGFCAALRRSELVAVQVEHIEFTSQGIILTVPRSKTDQHGQGRKIGIARGKGRICPVTTIYDWIVHRSASAGPLFPAINKAGTLSSHALTPRSVADLVKHYIERVGYDATRYSSHSMRAGLATSAAQRGIASWVIRKTTGHRSEAMLGRYLRDADLFTNNASALF